MTPRKVGSFTQPASRCHTKGGCASWFYSVRIAVVVNISCALICEMHPRFTATDDPPAAHVQQVIVDTCFTVKTQHGLITPKAKCTILSCYSWGYNTDNTNDGKSARCLTRKKQNKKTKTNKQPALSTPFGKTTAMLGDCTAVDESRELVGHLAHRWVRQPAS